MNNVKSGRYYISAQELAYIASIARDAPELFNFWRKVSSGNTTQHKSIDGANSTLPKRVQLTLADLAFEKMKAGQALSIEEQAALDDYFNSGASLSIAPSMLSINAPISSEDI